MKLIAILAILAVIVAVAIAIIYLMGQFEATRPIADQATGLGTQTADYVQKNIPTVVAAGGTVTALGGVALSKINSAKQQTQQVTDQAKTEIGKISDEKDALKTQITDAQETAKTQIAQATDLQKQAETKANELEQQTKTLSGQVQSAKDENAQFVKSLMQSANGALVTNPVDGKIYSVLKLPPEVQVK